MEAWISYEEWLALNKFMKGKLAYDDYIDNSIIKSVRMVIDNMSNKDITTPNGLLDQIERND